MDFYEVLDQVIALLRSRGRVSYRALARQFDLDDAYLEDLKCELIEAQQLARDENGSILVWTGEIAPQPPAQDDQATQADPAYVEHRASDAERRQLTVLFCDVVDSTALSSQLDMEDYRDVMRAYQATCATVSQRFEGYISQYLGDGVLVFFGYPQAHEDDAQRATQAGLGIVEAMEHLNACLQEQHAGVRLALRIGIHTGRVVIDNSGVADQREPVAPGETLNIAARIQSFAAPNTVVVSSTTFHLIQGSFTCRDLGRHTLRGVPMPAQLYHVLSARRSPSRLEALNSLGLTPLIGRGSEVQFLFERWTQVQEGMGQVVLLSGESGIGKSRLVQAFTERIEGELQACLKCQGSPYHQQTALYPVTELLERLLRWQREDTPAVKLRKLAAVLAQYALPLQETIPLLAALLSLPLPEDHYPPLLLSPQRQRQKTLDTILTLWLELTQRQPVLLIVEDLQWIDPSSLELLGLLVDQTPTVHSLILMTFRPTLASPWDDRSHVLHLSLPRLSPSQVHAMIAGMTDGKTLPAEVLQRLVSTTDGVPLFVEELTKAVLESGLLKERAGSYELTETLPALDIPATLQDSLMARLDRLATFKAVAQLGATLGRTFSYEILHAVSPLDETTLQQGLRCLVDAELLYQRGVPPQAVYFFKHVLIREVAYQSLPRGMRQHYHQQVAQVLTERFPDIARTQPELLAYHYTEAGLLPAAIPYWLQAGQHAVERSANAEAISHFMRGLDQLKHLPETPQSSHQELALQLALGSPLLMIKGHTAPEVEQAYSRAYAICQQEKDNPQIFSALVGLWRFYFSQARLQTAHELGEQCFHLAQRLQNPVFLHESYLILGSTLFHLGDLVTARTYLEQGIALYDPQQCRELAFIRGTDTAVVCLSRLAWVLWMLGYPEQALRRSQQALDQARQSLHAYSLAFALHFTALLRQARREAQHVREQAEATMVLSREQEFVLWLGGGMVTHGWALVETGAMQEGIEELRQGLTTWRAVGTKLGQTQILARLAEAYGKDGQPEEGLGVLAEALALMQQNTEYYHEAEIYRIKGQLLLQQATSDDDRCLTHPATTILAEAEACFAQAISVAQRQEAKSWELRAVVSLSHLWWQQGKHTAARQLLTRMYDQVTEGFETPDVQEAKALLAALSS